MCWPAHYQLWRHGDDTFGGEASNIMTVKITADTSDGLKFVSDTSGIVEIQNNGTTIITSSQPSFMATLSADQTGVSSSTYTKVAFATEEWDTDSKYDVSNYRFTPTVAGYYQFNIGVRCNSSTTNLIALYKNGAIFRRGTGTGQQQTQLSIMAVADTDDFFEAFVFTTGTQVTNNSDDTYFQAHYIRSA